MSNEANESSRFFRVYIPYLIYISETGKTAQEYIALRLYDYAKRQLRNSSLTIKEIAVQTGFQHPQHFVRFFKKHAGITPTEYRHIG